MLSIPEQPAEDFAPGGKFLKIALNPTTHPHLSSKQDREGKVGGSRDQSHPLPSLLGSESPSLTELGLQLPEDSPVPPRGTRLFCVPQHHTELHPRHHAHGGRGRETHGAATRTVLSCARARRDSGVSHRRKRVVPGSIARVRHLVPGAQRDLRARAQEGDQDPRQAPALGHSERQRASCLRLLPGTILAPKLGGIGFSRANTSSRGSPWASSALTAPRPARSPGSQSLPGRAKPRPTRGGGRGARADLGHQRPPQPAGTGSIPRCHPRLHRTGY